MKIILLVAHKMNLGGTEKALLSFLQALVKYNVKIKLVLLESGGELYSEIPNEVDVEVLDFFEDIKDMIYEPPLSLAIKKVKERKIVSALNILARYLMIKLTKKWYLNYRVALKKYKTLYKADIAIAYAGPSDFISYLVANHTHAAKKIQWIHFDVTKILANTVFGKRFYSSFDQIFCVSENARQAFDTMFPHVRDKSDVFHNIVSYQRTIELATQGNGFNDKYKGIRIVTLGRLSPEKGQQMIPEVVKSLKASGFAFRWYLIGDGSLFGDIERTIQEDHLENNLVLLGSKTNPYRYLKECDLYVQTSLHEGYCMTLHEAKVFNKPVVTTDFLSASNLIVHEKDGLIVDISVEGIYQGVKRVLEDTQLLTQYAHAELAKDSTDELDKLFQ